MARGDTAVRAHRALDGRGIALAVLPALGTGITLYLTWVHFSGQLALCAGAGGCATVQASRYATIFGVPIAVLGLLLYLALLGLGLWRVAAGPVTPSGVRLAIFGLALAGALYSLYLVYLQLFVLGAICPWCAASAVTLETLFIVATVDFVRALQAMG
jgi:uncharacterized membrane protein